MPTVIPVKFAYATRELWFDPADSGAVEGDHVICTTERGCEIGLATHDPYEVDEAELKRKTDGAELKRVLRVANDEDLNRAAKLAAKGDSALPTFRRLVSASELDMKPVGVEYLFGGEKVVCYFAAEERVDFRQLVRDLSRQLHERVDMRQIGVREEAAFMGGFAHCGQELCCSRFGSGFEPVSIRMAKEQDLPLNSNKISGACGRLMCCLRYEFEAYRDFKQRAPKKNAVIQTPLGTAKIVEYDTPKEQLCLRLESGKQVRVPLAEMQTSEAAHKKSEELGCPCRPDTVARDTLERLQSPEIRAALEELDRKRGVIPAETYEPDDLFVEERGGGRRRRNKGGNKGAAPAQQDAAKAAGAQDAAMRVEDAPEQGEGAPKRRRRRKTVEISEEQEARLPGGGSAPAKESAPGEGRRSRRRRHHVEDTGTGTPVAEAKGGATAERAAREARGADAGQQQERKRQRRQRGDGSSQGQQAEGSRAAREQQGEGVVRKRRRRPGDKGGAAAGAKREPRGERAGEQRPGREGGAAAGRERSQQAGKPRHMRAQGEGSQGAGTEGAPRRRRRHHKSDGTAE